MSFNKGQRVFWTSSEEYGTLTGEVKELGSRVLWQVDFDGSFQFVPETQLKLADKTKTPIQLFQSRVFGDFQSFRQYLTHSRIRGGLTNIVYSMKYGDVEFLPYQFKPVFKFISSNEGRLLIADEVGLGKTIEALYIWKELQAREDSKRLLIVAPAMLRSKWKKDMQQHFGIKAEIVDSSDLLDYCDQTCRDNRTEFALITSIQGIRFRSVEDRYLTPEKKNLDRVKLNRLFEDISDNTVINKVFDLVIIDEAQWVTNPDTANYFTARRINAISNNLVLLSATPVSNKESDLFSLLRIMSPEEYTSEAVFSEMLEQNRSVVKLAHCFYDAPNKKEKRIEETRICIREIKKTSYFGKDPYYSLLENKLNEVFSSDELRRETYDQVSNRYFYSNLFSRSRKRDVMPTARREPRTTPFTLTQNELSVYNDCTEDLKRMCFEEHGQVYLFAIMARQRELASSIPAALRRWRTIAQANWESIDPEEDELEEDIIEERRSQKEVAVPQTCLALTEEEIDILENEDTKYSQFSKALKSIIENGEDNHSAGKNEKIVVFSFFRNTLMYLARRLKASGISSIIIMGGMKQEEKDKALKEFKDNPIINVLLSSEVGAEGLDLQFSRYEFNYDLPWNPMRLEQRIGRIDRIGQKASQIFIRNMVCSNTIEDKVLNILYQKIDIFKNSIGELDEILGNMTQNIEKDLLVSDLSSEQKEEEAKKAIERICEELVNRKKLEEEAGLSKAFSDSILKYVSISERNNRYIRQEDLVNYLYDFFTKIANGSHFSKAKGEQWFLEFSESDRNAFRKYMNDNGMICQNSGATRITCTFPQGKRTTNYGAFNIDVNHPLTKWVYDQTDKFMKSNKPCRCYAMTITDSVMDKGTYDFKLGMYVFYVLHLKCEGLKKRNELMYFVCSVGEKQVFDSNKSEFFISQCLFHGMPVTDLSIRLSKYDSDDIDDARKACCLSSDSRVKSIISDFEIDMEAAYHRMMVKTKSFYENKISEKKERIIEAEQRLLSAKSEQERINYQRILPAIRGQLETRERQYKETIDDIEKKKDLIPSIEELAIGVVFLD